MNDIPSSARAAREALSRGLNALQSDPSVPPQLLEIAGSIAQAMGALLQIERSNGVTLSPHAGTALNAVRAALAQLQAQPTSQPAVVVAMEAVAGSLGVVHALSKLAGAPAQPAPQAPAQPAWQAPAQAAPVQPRPQAAQQPAPQQQWQQPAQQPAPQQQWQQPAQQPAPQQQWQQPAQQPAPQQQWQQPAQQPAPQQQWQQPAQQPAFQAAAHDPFAAPRPQPGGTSPLAATTTAPPQSKNPPAPAMPTGDVPVVTADLGTQSSTNFYKGLAGNDIVEHGGLFVATYVIPNLGAPVRLKVSLPGGYEFEANAVVRWRRELSDGGDPGFGAQFTQITQEARQLVHRYARNREPLFHDDL